MKYPGRAPEGSVLLRVFIGGACQAGLLRFPRAQLIELATREVADLLQIRGEPQWQSIVRHRRALPQYHVGHADLVSRIQTRLKRYPTLSLAGSSLEGVGVPSCILSGERAAQRVASTLAQTAFNEFHFANR
jgi:oxygen-dependent protoporphyrinogen oxidase